MRTPTYIAIFAALSFAAPFAATAEEGHIVPVHRAEKVGDKTNLIVDVEESSFQKVTKGAEVLQEEKKSWKATLELGKTVDKVDAKGDPTELTLAIKKFTLEEDGKPSEGLPAGTVVRASSVDGKDFFSVESKELDEQIKEILKSAVSLSDGPAVKGDENKAFGCDKPHKPGEEWDVNIPEMLATMPPDVPLVIDEKESKGKVKMVEVTGEGDNKAAVIQANVDMNVKEMKGMPPGAKVNKASVTVALDGRFPLIASKPPIREGMYFKMSILAALPSPDGPIDLLIENTRTRKMKVVP